MLKIRRRAFVRVRRNDIYVRGAQLDIARMKNVEARPIDGNALRKDHALSCPGDCASCDACSAADGRLFCGLIDEAPTLDAVPVVRCRECKHYRENERCSMSAVYRHCALHKGLAMVTPDSFCSYGERREDNGQDTIGDSPRT